MSAHRTPFPLVGKRVRQLRAQSLAGQGMTQEELAEAAGISVSYVSMVERDERSPHLNTLAALAHVLGTTVADLLSQPREGEEALVHPLVEFIRARQLTAPDVERLVAAARLMFPAPEGGEGTA
ncbi:XRE family transcriptional regulator [Corallococcus sp. CA047B]|uniref:helix-turn-helix domain-containing protein n=1 Tax=Corallococcus sp. CA047B TaxID=2316729 RepID=UPI000EA00BBA|nr:helix-turn-helix transcriptional regulator [Corallococcus sp. CA047B]RKH11991.1 XRE family transcriptional regulator [Corallococcus sp. CA047B]